MGHGRNSFGVEHGEAPTTTWVCPRMAYPPETASFTFNIDDDWMVPPFLDIPIRARYNFQFLFTGGLWQSPKTG